MSQSEVIARRLKMARKQAGLSQSQVAKLMGIHRPTVSEMEAGRRKVAAEELSKMAEIYDVRLSWLAGSEEETDENRDRIELAARELAKMDPEELDRLLKLISTLRQDSDEEE